MTRQTGCFVQVVHWQILASKCVFPMVLERSVYVMKMKPTLYIIDKYKDGTDDLEETISFPIHETNDQSLLPYMNKNCDIWLGRYNKRRGKLIKLEPLRFGDKVE